MRQDNEISTQLSLTLRKLCKILSTRVAVK
jgi:hypothetical protein